MALKMALAELLLSKLALSAKMDSAGGETGALADVAPKYVLYIITV